MQTSIAPYKLIKRAKDDRFEEESLHEYDLLIQTGPKDFQVAVVNHADNRLLVLEDYAMGNVQSHAELLAALKELFDNHAFLKAGFWNQVKIGIKNGKFCQVPESFFEEPKATDYLRLNVQIDDAREKVLWCRNRGAAAVTVFAVQQDLFQWLDSIYQHAPHHFFHQGAALIEGVLRQTKPSVNTLYLYVDRFKLHILSAHGGKLNYYNQFPIKQFSDYVKYIMLVLKGLDLDQQTSEMVVWGYIGKNSPHYLEFVKYIRNVVFGDRPAHLKFNYFFDEVQGHHFFDLYALQLLDPA